MKTSHPECFESSDLYCQVLKLLHVYKFRLQVRRFVYQLFADVQLSESHLKELSEIHTVAQVTFSYVPIYPAFEAKPQPQPQPSLSSNNATAPTVSKPAKKVSSSKKVAEPVSEGPSIAKATIATRTNQPRPVPPSSFSPQSTTPSTTVSAAPTPKELDSESLVVPSECEERPQETNVADQMGPATVLSRRGSPMSRASVRPTQGPLPSTLLRNQTAGHPAGPPGPLRGRPIVPSRGLSFLLFLFMKDFLTLFQKAPRPATQVPDVPAPQP